MMVRDVGAMSMRKKPGAIFYFCSPYAPPRDFWFLDPLQKPFVSLVGAAGLEPATL